MNEFRSEPIPFDQVCARLCQDPYYLLPSQVADLTPFQVKRVYFRDESLDVRPRKLTMRQAVAESLRKRGFDEATVARELEAFDRANPPHPSDRPDGNGMRPFPHGRPPR